MQQHSIWIDCSTQLLQLPAPAFLLKLSLAQWASSCCNLQLQQVVLLAHCTAPSCCSRQLQQSPTVGLVGSLHSIKLLQPRASATICCWSRFTTCWQICSMNLSKSSNVVCVPWRYVRQHCRSRQRHVKLSSFVLLSDSFLQHSAANFS